MAEFVTKKELASGLRELADRLEKSRTGLLLPLYIRPGAAWDRVAAGKKAYPTVPLVAIANPRNGPGDAKSDTYAQAIPKLAASGVTMAGYVHTQYGTRPMADVERDARRWREWYPDTTAIFVDEFSSKVEHLAYYQSVQKLARDIGFTLEIGNPGTRPNKEMYQVADALVVSEQASAPSISTLEAMAADGGQGKMGVLVHGAPLTLVDSWLPEAKRLLAYAYLTEDVKPSPWDTISAKFERQLEILSQQ